MIRSRTPKCCSCTLHYRRGKKGAALRKRWLLRLIDHKRGHLLEKRSKKLFGLSRQSGIRKRFVHQLHPAVAGGLIDPERKVSRPQARMSSLFDVSLRASEPVDQEIAQALLGARTILLRVHRSENVVLRDLAIKRSHEARETFLPNN